MNSTCDYDSLETANIVIDINNIYLYSEIDMKVYMIQSLEYIDPRYPNHVYKLLKSLYSLK
jgi:hypothetical protein